LQKIDSTVLLVSHDRSFLDAVCTDIVQFHKKTLHYYPGNYSDFEQTKHDEELKMQRINDSVERQRKHIEDSIQKMHNIAKNSNSKTVTSQIASRKKKLERHGMEKNVYGHRWRAQTESSAGRGGMRIGSENENALGWKDGKRTRRSLVDRPDKLFKFSFPEPDQLRSGGPLVQLNSVSFGYTPDKPLFEDVTLEITLTSKIGLVGKNGCGKSTLMKLIAGDQDSAGNIIDRMIEGVYRHPNLKVCHFTQHHRITCRTS
jgi:ATPase subunit of ABC transporter with duplicated ATPase domains